MQPTFSRGLGGRPGGEYMSIHRACICHAQYTSVFSEEQPSEDGDEASSMDVSLVEEDILPAQHTMPVFHVVGTSKYASRLRQTIQSISENYPESPILIQGEYGCLKDEISELIHNNSGRHIFEVNDCALYVS
jgi:transcriptional regulator with PAS, ATPase and Fis domain